MIGQIKSKHIWQKRNKTKSKKTYVTERVSTAITKYELAPEQSYRSKIKTNQEHNSHQSTDLESTLPKSQIEK